MKKLSAIFLMVLFLGSSLLCSCVTTPTGQGTTSDKNPETSIPSDVTEDSSPSGTEPTPGPDTSTDPSVSTSEPVSTSDDTTIESIEPIAPEDYQPFQTTDKVVAFTFDDGPCWVTPQILDVIEGTNDKVTFFITGYMIDVNPTVYSAHVKRAYDMGCEIGSHTYDHQMLWSYSGGDISASLMSEQLDSLQSKYQAITGGTMHLMRPPGGDFNKNKNYGYALVLWSMDSEDWRSWARFKSTMLGKDEEAKAEATEIIVEEVVSKVLENVKSGDIVLMHDIYNTSALAFAKIYEALKEEGYRFVTVSELLRIDPSAYDGWYFFKTSQCGHDGVSMTAKAPSPAPEALLPEKVGE